MARGFTACHQKLFLLGLICRTALKFARIKSLDLKKALLLGAVSAAALLAHPGEAQAGTTLCLQNSSNCVGKTATRSGNYFQVYGDPGSVLTPFWRNPVGITTVNLDMYGDIKYYLDDTNATGFTSTQIPITTTNIERLEGTQIFFPIHVTGGVSYYLLNYETETPFSGSTDPVIGPMFANVWDYTTFIKNETDGSQSSMVQFNLKQQPVTTTAVTTAVANTPIKNTNTKGKTKTLNTVLKPALTQAVANSKKKSAGVSSLTVVGRTDSGIPIVDELPTPDNGGTHDITADTTVELNDIAKALLQLTSAEDIIAAADQLHGESFASYQTVEMESMSRFSMTVLDTCRENSAQINQDWRLCVGGEYTSASVTDGQGLGGFDYQISEFPLVLEHRLDPNWTIGLAGSYGSINQNEHAFQEADITGETYAGLGLIKYANTNGWAAHLMLGGGSFDNSSTRNISLLDRTATADWTSTGFTSRAGGSYTWAVSPGFGIRPYATFSYSTVNTPSFTETGGGDADLKIYSHEATSFRSELGAEFVGVVQLSGNNQFIPQLRLGYLNDAGGNQEHEIDTAFAKIDDTKTNILGRTLGSNAFVLEAVAEVRSGDISLFINGGGRWWDNGTEWSAGGGLKWSF